MTNGHTLRRTLCFGESSRSFIQFSFSFGRGSVELLNMWRFRLVAGGGFEPPTFGLCDLTHLWVRVGLYLHPHGVLAIQSLRLPPVFGGLVRYCPIAHAT